MCAPLGSGSNLYHLVHARYTRTLIARFFHGEGVRCSSVVIYVYCIVHVVVIFFSLMHSPTLEHRSMSGGCGLDFWR